jgi:hypothetical protein
LLDVNINCVYVKVPYVNCALKEMNVGSRWSGRAVFF